MTARLSLHHGRAAALAVLAASIATIAGAYVFEYGFGYVPCKLCLMERQPYYVAMPLAVFAALVPSGAPQTLPWRRIVFGILALLFIASAALGLYHAGVEWAWWLGPADCGGGAAPTGRDVADLMKALNGIKVVSCTEAAWRFAGLSLAGWNAMISAGLAVLAGWAVLQPAGER